MTSEDSETTGDTYGLVSSRRCIVLVSGPRRYAFSVNFGFAAGCRSHSQGIKTLNRMVTLKASPTNFVCDEATLEQEAEERLLSIPGVIFRQAIGLAESSSSFRAPARHFQAGQGIAFADALTKAFANQQEMVAPRRQSAQTALDQLYDFFNDSTHRRWLTKLMAYLGKNPGFSVVN